MSVESFFTEVVQSYQKLLKSSKAEASALSLREYCRSRHVAWRDFQRWAATAEVAAGLPTSMKKGATKTESSGKKSTSSTLPSETARFYPLNFISATDTTPEMPGCESGLLHGISTRLPNGVMIAIGRGSGREVSSLIDAVKP